MLKNEHLYRCMSTTNQFLSVFVVYILLLIKYSLFTCPIWTAQLHQLLQCNKQIEKRVLLQTMFVDDIKLRW